MNTQRVNAETRWIMSRYDIGYLNKATDDQLIGIYAASLVDLDEARDRSGQLESEIQRRIQRPKGAELYSESTLQKYATNMTAPNLIDG